MPLVNIHIRRGTGPAYRRSIADSVHAAMMEVLEIPADDRFEVVYEHDPENLIHDPMFLDVPRGERSVFLQLFLNHRPAAQKQRLFATIVGRLAQDPGLPPEDVFIGIVEVAAENWWAFARPVPD
jgi:phenylpyruvate tautomerase PptA (4-oxalocrotonate tautomerase family)